MFRRNFWDISLTIVKWIRIKGSGFVFFYTNRERDNPDIDLKLFRNTYKVIL